jgi:hypothetical protein
VKGLVCEGINFPPKPYTHTAMALSSKSLRELETTAAQSADDDFDFGDPEIISVEIAPGKFLSLQEPSAEDLIDITKISSDESIDEVQATLKTICILHSPEAGNRKLTLKDAKRLRAKQIKMLGEAINELLGGSEDEEKDMKS